jgi:CubicO group peptidase (beta-lactamase class C family)
LTNRSQIQGTVDPQFAACRDAFEANFQEGGERGAACAIYRDGQPVLDLWGGSADASDQTPWYRNTAVPVFSVTKGISALCVLSQVSNGRIDLDLPLAHYWPEFAAHGKDDIPVGWLLCHKSGLVDVDRPMTLEEALDWDTVCSALADSPPLWTPGTQHGYHAITYGWLVGEVVRRVSGRSLGQFFADEVAGPLGLEFWIGLPAEQIDRVVHLIPPGLPPGIHFGDPDAPPPNMIQMLQLLLGADSLLARALSAPGGAFGDVDAWNDPRVWQAEVPAANGITNASSLARMYAATVGEVDGIRLLQAETLKQAIEPQVEGPDSVLIFEIPFGYGFMRDAPFAKFGSPTAFGHYGAGGSVGFADHEARIGFGYVMNRMDLGIAGDPRTADLIAAVYSSL